MKKIHVLAISAVAALAVSCDGAGGGGVSPKSNLATSEDTLAYAYGIELAQQGLSNYLAQAGIVQDTAMLRRSYDFRIQSAADEAEKGKLQKEFTHKLDSVSKTNVKNLNEFVQGLKVALGAPESKAAYYRGVEIGGQLGQMSANVAKSIYGEDSKQTLDKGAVLAGVLAILNNQKPAVENAGSLFQAKMQQIQDEKMKKDYTANIEAGKKFLEENKTKEGVVTLPDGLQYKIIKQGNGAKPTATDQVKVHYHGTLIDGTVFDSSVERGEPTTFGVNQVIPGWTEVLQLMPVGSKWEVYIPENLAYGSRNAGSIQPFSTLVFEVELLDIAK